MTPDAETLAVEAHRELAYVQLGAVPLGAQETAQITTTVIGDPAPAAGDQCSIALSGATSQQPVN
ncbi:hypothetical protein GCM10009087_42950 [Sphingomonas oligophenolica]|uniref:Uncharacterized protein n=1 Tax=Sphingomonas oligophenolica TaxID=301154 RepID=A0ABU9XZK7_9SPHN